MLHTLRKIRKIKDKRVVLLQSGGLDSCVLACMFSKLGFEVHHMFVNYGQNSHEQERVAVETIVKTYGGTLHEAEVKIPWFNCAITNGEEVKCYDVQEDLASVSTGIYVPMRNQVLLSIAASLAESLNIKYIAAGLDGRQTLFGHVTSGTPDKHRSYIRKFEQCITEGSVLKHQHHGKYEMLTPLEGFVKEDTIELGMMFECDFTKSWSCYNKGDKPCGTCASCVDRINHFKALGMIDPTVYENNSLNHLD
jgi:7-cyano-7-deazaguanine synthase